MSNIQLANNLRHLRKQHELTQKDLSRMLNISRQAYSNYERGKRIPDIGMLIRLADIYGVSLEQLLTQTCTKDGVLNESHGPYYRGMVIENADTLYFTVDDCYRVDFTPHGLALHCLTPHGESLLAYYDSPASVFAAMLAHRTAGGCASLSEYTAEFNRLSALFSQEWQRVTGYQP